MDTRVPTGRSSRATSGRENREIFWRLQFNRLAETGQPSEWEAK